MCRRNWVIANPTEYRIAPQRFEWRFSIVPGTPLYQGGVRQSLSEAQARKKKWVGEPSGVTRPPGTFYPHTELNAARFVRHGKIWKFATQLQTFEDKGFQGAASWDKPTPWHSLTRHGADITNGFLIRVGKLGGRERDPGKEIPPSAVERRKRVTETVAPITLLQPGPAWGAAGRSCES
jgi:hypothetical protein